MAIDTYTNLKAAIIRWGKRRDLDLEIDDFIKMAETEMFNNPVENLRVRGQNATLSTTLSTTLRTLALPTGYLEQRSARLSVNNVWQDVYYRVPEAMNIRTGTGTPMYYTITTQFEFDIVADQAYTFEAEYIGKPTALSVSNATNAVLTNNPQVYLFGALWALKQRTEEFVESQNYYEQFINAIKGANRQYFEGQYGPSLTVTIDGPTP